MKKETMASIASKAGCSISTVSRVMSGQSEKYRISKGTADRVLKVLRKVDYVPVYSAQNSRKNFARSIGLLLPDLSNPYFAEMASVIIKEAYDRGYLVSVMDAREREEIFNLQLKLMQSRLFAGIVAIPCGMDAGLLEKVNKDIPVVLVDRYMEGTDLPYVTTNNFKGGYDATKILLEAGHRTITVIQGPDSSMPSRERVKGYLDAMEEAGLGECISVVGHEFSVQCGYLETKLLLSRTPFPDALFTLSNTIMQGAVKAITESGLKVPEDIALITFDNNVYMDYMNPVVARISQPVEDMAKLAIKILLDRIEQPDLPVSHIKLFPTYLPGQSI